MIEFLKSKLLHIVVFITGGSLLVLEVVATRLLSPYFGNTIYTVSSVIGIVLAALSLGYYIGGIWADKNPTKRKFFLIIFWAGLSTFFIKMLSVSLLPQLGYKLPLNYGPLVASILLFALPSFLLGTLSPYVISLEKLSKKKKGIGKVSGEIFFVSTLGSIAGTFLAGFYLIPTFGLSKIVIYVGFILTLTGLAGLFASTKDLVVKKNSIEARLIFIFAIVSTLTLWSEQLVLANTVYTKDGIYEKLSVYDTTYFGEPARLLMQDRSSSSAISLKSPGNLVFEYTKYVDLYKIVNPEPERALFIGGGAYTMPSYLIRNLPNIKVDVSEIEPELHNIAKKYFGLTETYRLNNYTEDGRRHLHDVSYKYDVIFSDVYSTIYSIPTHFTTVEFFELGKSRLTEDGIFIANIIGDLSRQKDSLVFSEINTFRKVFPNSYFFAVQGPQVNTLQNVIFVGLNSDEKLNLPLLQTKFKDDPILGNLSKSEINLERFDYDSHPVFVDEYAPVEKITKSLTQRTENYSMEFNGKESLGVINQLVGYGPRHVNSAGHDSTVKFLLSEIEIFTDEIIKQEWNEKIGSKEIAFTNIIGRVNPEAKNRLILGSHYDSLPDNPGANNSASGVSVLLELMRFIKESGKNYNFGIDFIFFDGEEGMPGVDWKPYGSEYLAYHLKDIYKNDPPQSAVIIDMVCDNDLNIFYEKDSFEKANELTVKVFENAKNLFGGNFITETKYQIRDDHTALNNIGIPSTLVIDFDYPYYNSLKDTPDKCSSGSLEKVGNSLINYLDSI